MSAAILPFPEHPRSTPPVTDPKTGWPQSALASGIRNGDHEAMEVLFRAYFAPLVTFARSYVSSVDDAEELVAGVFARLWERRAALAPKHTLESYLYAAVRNAALNAARSVQREGARLARFAEEGDWDGDANDARNGDLWADATGRQDIRALVTAALHALPETARVILSLRWGQQMSYEGIAEVLGGTAGSVQRQHSRILAKLRELVADVRSDNDV